MLIIPRHIYPSTRKCAILLQVIFCIVMHFILDKMSRNLVLLINNFLKRGDVKTLARSSISLSSQVKMKLKLTASRWGHLKLISYEKGLLIK